MAEFLMRSRSEAKKMSIYEYDAARQRVFDREEGIEIGEARGIEIGEARGKEQFAKLIDLLIEDGRSELIPKVAKDTQLQASLFTEYNL